MDFLKDNIEFIISGILVALGAFGIGALLKKKSFEIGKAVRQFLIKKLGLDNSVKIINEIGAILDSLEKGLLDKDYEGNKEITHNVDISSEVAKAKIELEKKFMGN